MSRLPRNYRLLVLVLVVVGASILAAFAYFNYNAVFDSDRFKNNPDETRLAMYNSLKAKHLNGWSKEQVVKLLGEPASGATEDNIWTYPMGQEADTKVELVLTFRKGLVKKVQKSKVVKDF